MSDFTGIYDISGNAMHSVTGSATDLSGNLNIRRTKQRRLYDRLLQGDALRSEVGEVSSSVGQPATPPSWTQRQIGKSHAYVIGELSSSHYETFGLNTFHSGNFALEDTSVPASASSYYSKGSRFVRKMYTVTASAGLTILPAPETSPLDTEVSGRANFVAVSGTYVNNSYFAPGKVIIDVPDYGKIRDVKVWVEFIHDVRTPVTPDSTTVDGL